MFSTVMDAASAPVDNVVVRVRGTFIDINPTVPTQSRRSGSAPPRRQSSASIDDASNDGNDSRYISEWIGRAMHLSDFRSSSQNDTFDGKCTKTKREEVANVVSKTPLEEKKGQNGISLFESIPMPAPNVIGEVLGSPGWAHVADAQYQGMYGNSPGVSPAKAWCFGADITGPPTTSIGQKSKSPIKPRWHEESYFSDNSCSLGLWSSSTVNTVASTVDSKCELEDPGAYKRLNLARSGPAQISNTRWLEENILSKQRLYESPAASEIVTTLMICDIPCRQTIDQVIDAINSHGFANTFNLVYMPSKRPKYLQNMGYAFVNFKTEQYATAFGQTFQNFKFPSSSSKKLSYTKPARHQGYTENVERYVKQRAVGCLVTFDDAVNGGQPQMWRQ